METKIGIIRGSSEEEVKTKQFNIYMGISLENNFFIKENFREYILWALKYTKEMIGVLIADTLHAINYEVKNKENPKIAIRRAVEEGNKFEQMIKEIISGFPLEKQKKIQIIHWDSIKKDDFSEIFIPFFYEEFKKNIKFREKIIKLVKGFVKRDSKKFSEREIEKLCEYVLQELPELFHGFTYKGIYYNCLIHPQDSSFARMIGKIQNKKLFPEFYDKIGTQKNVIIELKILK